LEDDLGDVKFEKYDNEDLKSQISNFKFQFLTAQFNLLHLATIGIRMNTTTLLNRDFILAVGYIVFCDAPFLLTARADRRPGSSRGHHRHQPTIESRATRKDRWSS